MLPFLLYLILTFDSMKVFFASAIMCFVTLFVGFHFVFASNGCVIDGQTPQDVISGCQGGGIGAYDK